MMITILKTAFTHHPLHKAFGLSRLSRCRNAKEQGVCGEQEIP